MLLTLTVGWRPLSEASKKSQGFLCFIPSKRQSLQTRGLYIMRWSGWGGGVWEDVNSGWRPMEYELIGTVWTELDAFVLSAAAAQQEFARVG